MRSITEEGDLDPFYVEVAQRAADEDENDTFEETVAAFLEAWTASLA